MTNDPQAQEYIGPQLDPDKFLENHHKWQNAETASASDAGERRQSIGAMFEEMRLEPKAASQARAILKIKNEGKRRDAVRSLRVLLPMLEAEILPDEEELFPANGGAETKVTTAETGVDDNPEDAETAEFNSAVDEAAGDDTVVPIGFGGEAAE